MLTLLDMDGVLVDLMGQWLSLYNDHTGDSLTVEEIDRYAWMDLIEPRGFRLTKNACYRLIKGEGWYADLPPYPGAVEGAESLLPHTDLMLCTALIRSPTCAWDKVRWIRKHLPFIPDGNFIMTKHKHLVRGDVLVDDFPPNLAGFHGVKILFNRPWNQSEAELAPLYGSTYYRAHDWVDVLHIIKKTSETIHEQTNGTNTVDELPGDRPRNMVHCPKGGRIPVGYCRTSCLNPCDEVAQWRR